MTQICYDTIDLSELMRRSPRIVLARPVPPFHSTESIPIHTDSETYPPFIQHLNHFETLESIAGIDISPGTRIDVLSAYSFDSFELHRGYYLEGMGKSPLFYRYQPMFAAADETPRFLFLRERSDGRYEFIVDNAQDGLQARSLILPNKSNTMV